MSSQPITTGDCAPSDTYNPKKNLVGQLKRRCTAFGELCDPVREELKDIDEILQTYSKYPIIPFFDLSDANLRLFKKLKDLSPSKGGIQKSIADYVLGGMLSVQRRTRPGFVLPDDDLSVTDVSVFNKMIDFIESLNPEFDGAKLLEEMRGSNENLDTYGNMFIKADFVEVAGERRVYIENIDAEKFRYHATQEGEPKIGIISAQWDDYYLQKYTPTFVNIYPYVTDYGNGVQSTIIHVKNKVTGRDWYGQPQSISSLFWQYMELQLGQFTTEGYANDFIARAFIEITSDKELDDDGLPVDDYATELDELNEAFEMTFTNQAIDKKRVILRVKLPGDEQATIHEFRQDMSHQFHVAMAAEAERQIIKAHNWHSVLMGMPTPGKLGTQNEFSEVFKQKYHTVIAPRQRLLLEPYNILLRMAAEYLGESVMKDYSLALGNLFKDVLSSDNDNSNDDGNAVDQDALELQQQIQQVENTLLLQLNTMKNNFERALSNLKK